jgi:hypothetical protein
MHTVFNPRFLKRAALKAARPARRHVVRALRHHATRTRALAVQMREAKPVDGMRAFFHSFFSALRAHALTRHFPLRTLLRRPNAALRAPATTGKPAARRPRRMAASTSGWFAFAMQ